MGIDEAKRDLDFAAIVQSGKRDEVRKFVEGYSPLVLGKIWFWMKDNCRRKSSLTLCTLLYLQYSLKKESSRASGKAQCDDCIDSYLWAFEYLKKRLKSYKAKNNCTLKTYIYALLNSKTMYIDWLRWKYGRAF